VTGGSKRTLRVAVVGVLVHHIQLPGELLAMSVVPPKATQEIHVAMGQGETFVGSCDREVRHGPAD
jgi:hypothetical protein